MESLEVGKSFYRQAMLVFLTLEIPSRSESPLRAPFASGKA
jgi:hypothetical protein